MIVQFALCRSPTRLIFRMNLSKIATSQAHDRLFCSHVHTCFIIPVFMYLRTFPPQKDPCVLYAAPIIRRKFFTVNLLIRRNINTFQGMFQSFLHFSKYCHASVTFPSTRILGPRIFGAVSTFMVQGEPSSRSTSSFLRSGSLTALSKQQF